MNGTNQVILLGNVGNEPKCGVGNSGKAYASFTLATTEKYKANNGDPVERTQWHNVGAFGFLAEVVQERVSKGSSVLVIGKLEYDKYTGKDGIERTVAKVVANTLQVIERGPPKKSSDAPREERAPRQKPKGKMEYAAPPAPAFDDDLLF
jgi:single-strand DNA-binding protein